MIAPGQTGLLIPNEDETAMADAPDQLMTDETQAARLAGAARERDEDFAMDKVMARWTATRRLASARINLEMAIKLLVEKIFSNIRSNNVEIPNVWTDKSVSNRVEGFPILHARIKFLRHAILISPTSTNTKPK